MVQAQSGAEVEDFEGIARASTASPGRLPEDGMDDGMEPEPEPELADPYEAQYQPDPQRVWLVSEQSVRVQDSGAGGEISAAGRRGRAAGLTP